MIRFKLDIGTHGIKVKVCFESDKRLMTSFYDALAVFEMIWDPKARRKKKVRTCTYATYLYRTNTYGLHINMMDDLLKHLKNEKVKPSELQIEVLSQDTIAQNWITISEGVEPRDYQVPIVEFLASKSDVTQRVLPLQTGGGKALSNNAMVQTPTGPKRNGDLVVGDLVLTPRGSTTEVIGVFPQGEQEVYEVILQDGRRTVASGDHYWKVWVGYGTNELQKVTTLELRELMKHHVCYSTLPETRLGEERDENAFEDNYDKSRQYASECDSHKSIESYFHDKSDQVKRIWMSGIITELSDGSTPDDDGCREVLTSLHLGSLRTAQYLARALGRTALLKIVNGTGTLTIEIVSEEDRRRIRYLSIEPHGVEETTCISIKDPFEQYIADQYTPTNNTLCTLIAIQQEGCRAAIVMGAKHITTWEDSIAWIYKESDANVRVVKGSKGIMKLIKDAQEGNLIEDILLFSVNIIRDYIKDYLTNGKSKYGCEPKDFYALIGVGLRVTDEAHENLHFGFLHDIEMNVPKAIYLSATIESDDPFKNKLYECIFPRKLRYTGRKWIKYIHSTALAYHIHAAPETVKCQGGNGMYSHTAYEQWISKCPKREEAYFKMILDVAVNGFIKKAEKGHKCLIFFSSVKMCQDASAYLEKFMKGYTHASYTGETETEVLYNTDVLCTTLGSAGTGTDLKMLRTVIMTSALSNREKNIQVLGRLRELEGIEPNFYYLVCLDIQKHVDYHNKKTELFKSYTKSVSAIDLGVWI